MAVLRRCITVDAIYLCAVPTQAIIQATIWSPDRVSCTTLRIVGDRSQVATVWMDAIQTCRESQGCQGILIQTEGNPYPIWRPGRGVSTGDHCSSTFIAEP